MADAPNFPAEPPGLDWVKLREEMDLVLEESTFDRLLRKLKENPLVPIGSMVTVGALTYGLVNFVRGKKRMQQNMMRLRVGAQLFTVAAMVGGVFYSLPKEKRNLEGLRESAKASNANRKS